MLYDAHTHLNSPELFPKYEKLLENFLKVGWRLLVNVWVDYERTQRALQISKNYPQYCLSTVGFHPSEPIFKKKRSEEVKEVWKEKFKFKKDLWLSWKEYLEEVEKYIRQLIESQEVVAIWECGLDYHYTEKNGSTLSKDTIQKQKELFLLQCKLAQEYNFPLIVHSRDAFEDTIEILKDFKDLKIYFHCWWYSPKEIQIVRDIFPNLWVGFDGNITYKKADALRQSAQALPLQNILLETDAPYLTPQIIRKEQNQPANVKYVYEYVANLKNIDLLELELAVENNFFKFYGI